MKQMKLYIELKSVSSSTNILAQNLFLKKKLREFRNSRYIPITNI